MTVVDSQNANIKPALGVSPVPQLEPPPPSGIASSRGYPLLALLLIVLTAYALAALLESSREALSEVKALLLAEPVLLDGVNTWISLTP